MACLAVSHHATAPRSDPRSRAPRHGVAAPTVMGRQRTALMLGLALLALVALPAARAQLLVDVLTSAAIAAEFDSGIHFPRGSVRAVGTGTAALEARVADRQDWTDWEVYAATGIAAGLQAGFVHQVATSFALAGYFESARSEVVVGGETRTHIVFEGDDGARLLFVIRAPQEVVWLTARRR